MSDPQNIKQAFERNKKAIELGPSIGQSTARTTIRVRKGITSEIESGSTDTGRTGNNYCTT